MLTWAWCYTPQTGWWFAVGIAAIIADLLLLVTLISFLDACRIRLRDWVCDGSGFSFAKLAASPIWLMLETASLVIAIYAWMAKRQQKLEARRSYQRKYRLRKKGRYV